MSRFRTQAQQKNSRGFEKGLVDIVIGTHRVLSKDVGYKDLGLLIIDEEQRFGVTHKEKLKIKRKYRCVDADSNANPKNTSYEFDRNSRYECA